MALIFGQLSSDLSAVARAAVASPVPLDRPEASIASHPVEIKDQGAAVPHDSGNSIGPIAGNHSATKDNHLKSDDREREIRKSERARCYAILASDAAIGQEVQAFRLAFFGEMPADQAIAALGRPENKSDVSKSAADDPWSAAVEKVNKSVLAGNSQK